MGFRGRVGQLLYLTAEFLDTVAWELDKLRMRIDK